MLTFSRKNLSVALAGFVVGSSLTWRAGLDTPDAARPGPDVPAASLDWGDDYNHFIVDAAGRMEPTQSHEPLGSTDDREILAPAMEQSTSPAVQHAVATGRLVLTEPRTDSERAAATALPAGKLFAVDADGGFWAVDSETGAVRRAGAMPPSQAQPMPAPGATVSGGPASGDATGAAGDVVAGAVPHADAAFVAALAAACARRSERTAAPRRQQHDDLYAGRGDVDHGNIERRCLHDDAICGDSDELCHDELFDDDIERRQGDELDRDGDHHHHDRRFRACDEHHVALLGWSDHDDVHVCDRRDDGDDASPSTRGVDHDHGGKRSGDEHHDRRVGRWDVAAVAARTATSYE